MQILGRETRLIMGKVKVANLSNLLLSSFIVLQFCSHLLEFSKKSPKYINSGKFTYFAFPSFPLFPWLSIIHWEHELVYYFTETETLLWGINNYY